MRFPKAPSWPIIIASGLVGGLVNWWFNTTFPGMFVFAALSALLMAATSRRSV